MTRLIFLLCILFTLACGTTAPLALSPTAITAVSPIPINTPIKRVQKPANTPNLPHPTTYVIAIESLYIRAGYDHDAEIVGYLLNGEAVTVFECRGVWARIGADRWVNSVYLERTCE